MFYCWIMLLLLACEVVVQVDKAKPPSWLD